MLVRSTIKWCIVSAILLTKVCAGLIPEVKASNTSTLNDEDLKEIKRRAQERRLELFHQCYEHLLEKITLRKQAKEAMKALSLSGIRNTFWGCKGTDIYAANPPDSMHQGLKLSYCSCFSQFFMLQSD